MRPTPHHLKQGWIYLLFWLICTSGYAAPGAANVTAPPMLRDVRIIYQNERWQVVLSGSGFTTCKAMKTEDPLRLVLDLPNTTSYTVSFRKIFDSEIVDTIDTLVLFHGPQPLARVVIGLYEDISYQISQSREEIRVSFAAPLLLSQTDSSPGEAASGALTEINPVNSRRARTGPLLRLPEKKSGHSARDVGESNLPPASKLLEIRAVEVDEKLLVSILANGSLHRYRAFHLTNPSRLVVDIMGIQSTKVKSVYDFGGPLVDKIRVAPRKGRVRVTFDLVPQLGLPYQVVSGSDRLQISFSMNTFQRLKTPATPGAAGTSEKETEAHYHQVSDGDTLFSIGRRYGLTVEQLRRLNDLEPETLIIYPDQILLVRPQSDR